MGADGLRCGQLSASLCSAKSEKYTGSHGLGNLRELVSMVMKDIQVCLPIVILYALLIVLPLTVRAEVDKTTWNTVPLESASSQTILRIQKGVSSVVPASWEEVPKSLEIEFIGIQGSQILLVFEKNAKRHTYVCVFDVEGHYLYGYRLKQSHNDTQFALSP